MPNGNVSYFFYLDTHFYINRAIYRMFSEEMDFQRIINDDSFLQ